MRPMKRIAILLALLIAITVNAQDKPHIMLVMHGGAGTITRGSMTAEMEKQYRETLEQELLKDQQRQANPHASIKSDDETRHGTVGAVALDSVGNLAAGTSTGGTTNKQYGRVGDSPIIGAGTYADNDSVAVSCTGTGEFFIRWTVAHDIAALYQYKGMSVKDAGDEVIHRKLENLKPK